MQNDVRNIYAIPGWTFASTVFSPLNSDKQRIIGLDYYHINSTQLEYFAIQLAKNIPQQSTLMGWSFGGLIATKIATMFPHKIRKLWLYCTIPRWKDDNIIEKFNNNHNRFLQQFLAWVNYPNHDIKFKQFLYQHTKTENVSALLSQLHCLYHSDCQYDYQNLSIPVFHTNYRNDAIIKKHILSNQHHNHQIIIQDKGGHAGFIYEKFKQKANTKTI